MKKKILCVLCLLLLSTALMLSVEGASVNPTSPVAEAFYEEFSAWLDKVALGETASTELSLDLELLSASGLKTEWTSSDGLPEFNADAVAKAFWDQLELSRTLDLLERNRPFALCWYDKTESGGAAYKCSFTSDKETDPTRIEIVAASVALRVSQDYRGAGYDPNTPTVRPDRIQEVLTAQEVADAIVEAHAGKETYEALCAFRDEILPRVSYNTLAAGGAHPYGDSWQPLYVFDGDPETNVVCEGYAKALQYLSLGAGLDVRTVSGRMNGENHMWNVVTLQDGRNYLLDLTNTDEGTVGEDGELFLAGAIGSVEAGYTVTVHGEEILYQYDADTLALFDTAALTLSSVAYTEFFGVGFESTADTMLFPFDGKPLKAFSRTETVTGDPAWLNYTKGAIIYFGDPSIDETEDLTPAWYALHADGTRGEKLEDDPIDAGSYVLVVTRIFDGKEFASPTVTVTPVSVAIESVSAADRSYDGTTVLPLLGATLSADVPLPAHLSLDLSALHAALPRAEVGIYSHVLLTGEFRFATEERNYVLSPTLTVPLASPLTVSKAPAPTLAPVALTLAAPRFSFDTAAWVSAALPSDAGNLLITVTQADKWGRLNVTEWQMDESARITAEFTGLYGDDRLEFLLTVTSQNYEDATLTVVATAPCPYETHVFADYRADGNATCRSDGTKTAVCNGCTVTDTQPDGGSRLPHTFDADSCTLCGTPAPLPPETEQETTDDALPSTDTDGEETDLPETEAVTDVSTEETTSDTPAAPTTAFPWELTVAVILILVIALLIKKRKN